MGFFDFIEMMNSFKRVAPGYNLKSAKALLVFGIMSIPSYVMLYCPFEMCPLFVRNCKLLKNRKNCNKA